MSNYFQGTREPLITVDCWDQGNTYQLSIIFSTMNRRWNKQTNMGSNDKHFWAPREQHKSFSDQGNLSLKHIREYMVLLLGKKG